MKTYGTREEVYNGFAKKTRGGLTPNDIIKRGDKYISKRMSNSMKSRFRSQKKKDTTISTGGKFKISTSTSSGIRRPKKTKKCVKFNLGQNKVNKYYCPELNDIDLEDEYDEEVDFQSGNSRQRNQPKPFRITAPPEIDLDSLFEDD